MQPVVFQDEMYPTSNYEPFAASGLPPKPNDIIPTLPHPTFITPELKTFARFSCRKLPNFDMTSNIDKAIRALELSQGKKVKRCKSPSQVNSSSKRPPNYRSAFQPPELEQTNWKKENHNAVEKKRRENINAYIEDIHDILLEEKLVYPSSDKLSTLSAAIEHLKYLKSSTTEHGSPLIQSLIKEEFFNLTTSVVSGFLITFKCEDLKIIYASIGTANLLLGLSQSELVGQEITKFLHPSEVDKFISYQKESILDFHNPTLLPDKAKKLSYSTYVHTMQGFLPGLNPQLYNFPVLFTGGFKKMTLFENDAQLEGVLCFTAVLKNLYT